MYIAANRKYPITFLLEAGFIKVNLKTNALKKSQHLFLDYLENKNYRVIYFSTFVANSSYSLAESSRDFASSSISF